MKTCSTKEDSETDMKNIAVIGISGVYPGACDLNQLHENLITKADSICQVPESRRELLGLNKDITYQEIGFLEEIEYFDNNFFNISNKEAANMSPEQRISLELAVKAILDAGYSLTQFKGKNCGIFVASQDNDYYSMLAEKTGLAWIGSLKSMISGKIAYHLDLHGPNIVLDTGCSSVLVCVDDACRRLETGEIDYALVGGVTVYLKFGTKNTDGDLLGIEADNGRCKPFDENADGIGVGEGGGFLLLKRVADARKDSDNIYGVIRATAVNGDGARCNSITTPSIEGQKEAILRAWKEAGIQPSDITEIEAHGTGTKLGDPIEIESFTESYMEASKGQKQEPIYIGSIKGNIGHLNATAGMASMTKVLLGFGHRVIYPLCHFTKANPLIEFDQSPLKPARDLHSVDSAVKRLAGVNSFGLSGTNAHVIIENNIVTDVKETVQTEEQEVILKLSAKNMYSFEAYRRAISDYLKEQNVSLQQVAYTLNTGRDDYAYRKVVKGKNKEELIEALDKLAPVSEAKCRNTVLVLTQIGHQDVTKLPAELCLYQEVKRMGIPFSAVIVDAFGCSIVEHATEEYVAWNTIREQLKGEPALDERSVLQKLNEMAAKEVQDVIWIGDYKEEQSSAADIYYVKTAEDVKELAIILYEHGIQIDWTQFYDKKLQKVSAPTYYFEKHKHWGIMETRQDTKEESQSAKTDVLVVENIGETLKNIWMEVLDCEAEEVERNTDFFDLGGNSLIITSLVDEFERIFGIEVLVDEIYDYDSFEKQLNMVKERIKELKEEGNEPPVVEEHCENTSVKECRLLPMQQLILNSIRRHPEKSNWNLTLTFKMDGKLDVKKMNHAFCKVCENHELLRSRLEQRDGEDIFVIQDTIPLEMTVVNIEKASVQEAESEVQKKLKEDALKPVDVTGDQLVAVTIYEIQEEIHYLFFQISHLIADGWSLNIIFDELCTFYSGKVPVRLEEKRFADYVAYENAYLSQGEGKEQVKHWMQAVQKVEIQVFPKYEGTESVIEIEYLLLNQKIVDQLRNYAKARKVSLFQVVLLLYHLTVQDYLERDTSVIGVMTGNRNHMEYISTVGLFARTLLSTLSKKENDSVESLLLEVKKEAGKMLSQQICSIGSLIGVNKKETVEDFVDFLLTYQNFKNNDMVLDGIRFSSHMIREIEAICPMAIIFYESPEAMMGSVQYDPEYFKKQDVKKFIQMFHKNVKMLIQEEK